ncbi:MAG: amidohydrolase family protein, partial [Actinomycetia bacterium]|nr:amidohydrolase family protein [Actinomycetes bacterium]
ALTGLASLGITSIGAMIGYGEAPSEKLAAEVDLWRRAAHRLPIRVHGIVIADTPEGLSLAAANLNAAGGRLAWLGVKRFADGSLGGHTAAMHAPFSDVETTGTFRLTNTDTELARASLRLGGMVMIHAIGDRAVDGALDVFDILVSEGAHGYDLRMEHVSVLSPQQVTRFARLGGIACVQPAFLASESTWLEDRLGADRMPWAYPLRSLASAGVTLAGSSDCPVEPPHPLWGIAAAIDRHGINESERLTGAQALEMFTGGAASALREPTPLGIGSPADFVVLDVDPLRSSADSIHDATVLATYVGGAPVAVDRTHNAWVDD